MPLISVPFEDLRALRPEEPLVTAERDPNSASCRQDRAHRALDLMYEIELRGGRRVDYVVFTTFGVCTDVPVISYDGIRFTYAYPAEHRGVAVLVPCQHGCGSELPIEVETAEQVALVHGALWAHDCADDQPTLAERARHLTDHIGRGTR